MDAFKRRWAEVLTDNNHTKHLAGLLGILFLVPATTALGLYPSRWWLDVVSFQIATVHIDPYRGIIVAIALSTVAIAYVSWRQQVRAPATDRNTKVSDRAVSSRAPNFLLIAALVASGVVLMTPSRLGEQPPKMPASWTGYPKDFSSSLAREKLADLQQRGAPSTSLRRILALVDQAELAVGLMRATDQAGLAATNQRIAVRISSIALEVDDARRLVRLCNGAICASTNQAHLEQLLTEQSFFVSLLEAGAAPPLGTPSQRAALAAKATAAVKVEIESLDRYLRERTAWHDGIAYFAAASVAFILAMYVVGFRSPMMALLLFGTFIATIASEWPVSLNEEVVDWIIVLYPAFICAISGFLWRFAFRAFKDNRQILNALRLSPIQLSRFVSRVLIAAAPFPLLVIGAHLLSQKIYDNIAAIVYCDASVVSCAMPEKLVYDSDPTRDTLRDDVNTSIQRLLLNFESQAVSAAGQAPQLADDALADTRGRIATLFNEVLPPNLFDIYPDLTPPRSCWRWFFYDLKCFARKVAYERLNALYKRPRNQLWHRIDRSLTDLSIQVKRGVSVSSETVAASIKGEADHASRYAMKAVDATFIGFSVFAVLQMALALLVAMRAHILLAGRTLYGVPRPSRTSKASTSGTVMSPNSRMHAYFQRAAWPPVSMRLSPLQFPLTHEEERPTSPPRAVTIESQEVEIPRDSKVPAVSMESEEFELAGDWGLPLLVKRKYDVDDAHKETAILRSRYHQWPLRRLLHGSLILRWAWRENDKSAIRFSGPAGSRFIVWKIPENCEVFFRWNDFVAMSASATLRKTISLRIGTLMTGTVMLPSIVGPGFLIQVSRGISELNNREDVPPSIFPHRLLSWESGAGFRVRSSRGILSLYFDPPSLEPTKGSTIAIDTDGGSSHGVGLLKELARLVRP